MMKPLSNLLKKKLSFEWKEEQQRVFENLKKKTLIHLYVEILGLHQTIQSSHDANDFTIKGVFMQDGHSIIFEGKKIYGAQLRWPIHEKELYAMAC